MKNKLKSSKKKKGFTLIEIVVVIAIMSILALIVVPNLSAYINKADKAKIMANLKTFHSSAELVDKSEPGFEVENDTIAKENFMNKTGLFANVSGEELAKYQVAKIDGKLYVKYEDFIYPEYSNGSNGGEPEDKNDPVYTEEQIDELLSQGYIEVSNAQELQDVRNNLSGKYIQTSDIDLSTIDNFSPIGDSSNSFTGTYNGGNFTINNLKIDRPTQNHVGLFGYVSDITLQNVRLENTDITGKSYVGGLIGYSTTSIDKVSNSTAEGSSSGFTYVGLLFGYYDGIIMNS